MRLLNGFHINLFQNLCIHSTDDFVPRYTCFLVMMHSAIHDDWRNYEKELLSSLSPLLFSQRKKTVSNCFFSSYTVVRVTAASENAFSRSK